MKLVTVATCNLDQWALDFTGNAARIKESIRIAKAKNAKLRLGPELEIPGYGCEDHFLEHDTTRHSWDVLRDLLQGDDTCGLLVDVGMPVEHNGVLYNCRVLCYDRVILLIRPKRFLADDGNYRETRWFTAWNDARGVEEYQLPSIITQLTGQVTCPIGIAVLTSRDGVQVACESCEELFTPNSPHITLSLDGVDIITNGSGSHHQLRKLNTRVDLMKSATAKCGGVYMYANQQGCDGGRLYFDGCAMVLVNGECVGQGSQFSVRDIEVVEATIDIEDIRSYRGKTASRNTQAASISTSAPRISIPGFDMIVSGAKVYSTNPSQPIPVEYHLPEEEIGLGPACWLWDYLRRSGASGFFLPLSGGADSASTCAMVGIMCKLVFEEITEKKNAVVLQDLRRIVLHDTYVPTSAEDIANRIMHTCYMGTSNSGNATKKRADELSQQIGTYHAYANIDSIVSALVTVFITITTALLATCGGGGQKIPRFESQGGDRTQDLALQNIQARLRMVLAYMLAQLLPWVRGRQGGWLLVLGSANVDESLRGYMTKYDCSSADINPIGAISKRDLKRFLAHAATQYKWSVLKQILDAPPTAELRPVVAAKSVGVVAGGTVAGAAAAVSSTSTSSLKSDNVGQQQQQQQLEEQESEHTQLDEVDMGMTYDELSWYGRLRKDKRCGPFSMYQKLLYAGDIWKTLTPSQIATKVKTFFRFYGMHRHKMTTLTPSYYAESYCPDDNRYDLRPFLYNSRWDAQFAAIDEDVRAREDVGGGYGGGEGVKSVSRAATTATTTIAVGAGTGGELCKKEE